METIARGITYTDLLHAGRRRIIATAVLRSAGGAVLVDPGPSSCLDTLRASLAGAGIGIGDVRALLLTHIHLDHAGAAGSLLRENPDIEVYVHERGAPHMIDPSKLLASAARLYGDEMDDLWGPFLPVPADRVRVLAGGERIAAADRELEVAYTPGHASHHVSFFDRSSGVAFVGDVAGVRIGRGPFVLPPTPPPDIDIDTWNDSVELVRRWRPATLLVTHFGVHEDPDAHLDAMRTHLAEMAGIARTVVETGGSDAAQVERFTESLRAYMARHLPAAEADLYGKAAPLEQCWLGLARYWRKRGVGVPAAGSPRG